jgi:quercetin dioxygenase-like cupin family protein
MAIPHAASGEVVDVRPLGTKLGESRTQVLVKTPTLEIVRLVLPAGKQLAEHRAPGEIVVQCLEGLVRFDAGGMSRELGAGDLLYLDASAPHALEALRDTSLLVTLLLPRAS